MAKVKCPRCFTINPEGKDVCMNCSAPLPKIRIEAVDPSRRAAPAPNTTQFQQGQRVANRYTVKNLIGRGGMGSIYKVQDTVLGEEVALKTLLPKFVRDKLIVDRFFNEARIARKLSHPNIVRVHDIGQAGNSIYISMELLQGQSLRALLDTMPNGKRLPIAQVVRILMELCDALAYAHQFTIHRDIKPENVMIDEDGRVKLMDFGISKLMANTRLTGADVVMGTPFYMSPEQLRNSRDVDARADIFSVGVMMYEMLTGNLPTGVPKPASQLYGEVPPNMDQIIAKCVATEPGQRFQNARELKAALGQIKQILETGAVAPPKASAKKSGGTSVPWKKIAGGVLAAAIVVGMIVGLRTSEEHRRALAEKNVAVTPVNRVEAMEDTALLERIKKRALGNSAADEALIDAGNRFYDRINDPELSDSQAENRRFALQCYLAALMTSLPETEGMVFVPPGHAMIDGTAISLDGFFMDATEVSQQAFSAFCDAADWVMDFDIEQLDTPMTWVTYYDALAYAAWQKKRLPTRAQWRRAAYGDAVTGYPWGEEWEPQAANTSASDGFQGAAPVGSFEQDVSAFGCRDMAGNVAEWTSSAVSGAEPDFGVSLWICGGDYQNPPEAALADREELFEMRREALGFRCVLPLPEAAEEIQQLL